MTFNVHSSTAPDRVHVHCRIAFFLVTSDLWKINNKTPNVSVGIWVYAVFDIHYVAATISALEIN